MDPDLPIIAPIVYPRSYIVDLPAYKQQRYPRSASVVVQRSLGQGGLDILPCPRLVPGKPCFLILDIVLEVFVGEAFIGLADAKVRF